MPRERSPSRWRKPLERDVPEGHSVTFLRGAFEQLELDGVVTPMTGTYVWEPVENAIVYPGVASMPAWSSTSGRGSSPDDRAVLGSEHPGGGRLVRL